MLEFHHIGVLVNDIDKAVHNYQIMFPVSEVSEIFFVSSQNVNVCFVKISENIRFELVQSLSKDSAVSRLEEKGFKYYHVGYLVKDFDNVINHLEANGFKLLNKFNSEAFENRLCAFLISPDMHLIELIQS